MTEDDTFNALRRTPFESVLKELAIMAGHPDDLDIVMSVWSSNCDNLDSFWTDFFITRGWTIKKFEKECKNGMY